MDYEDLKYHFAERLSIMTESRQPELTAIQQARREVRDMLKEEMGLVEANKIAMKIEKEVLDAGN